MAGAEQEHEPAIGLLGCGRWGRNHLRVWAELGCLAAVCDVDPARREVIRREHPGVRVVATPEEILTDPTIEGVVVATPAVTHAPIAADALAHGKDVLVEKPLALHVEDAESLVAAAAQAARILMVGHVLEYHPAFVKLSQLVRDGVLGKVLYAYSHRLNFGTVRTQESALWSFAPHDLALLARVVGVAPLDVSCRGGNYLNHDVADVTVMNLRFPGGVHAHVFVSWLHPFKEHRFIVVGDRQMAVIDDTAPWESKLVLYPHAVDWMAGRVPVARRAEAEVVPVEPSEPLRAECEQFLASIRSRQRPLTDGESGLDVLRVLDAGERSLQAGGAPVPIGASRSRDAPLIHPTSTVGPGASIGEGTRVWHYSHVMDGAKVGDRCVLGQNTFVASGVRIGNGVRIQNNVSVYEGVELEDNVFCGPSAVFTNVTNPRSDVNRRGEFRPTIVRRGATLGANSTIVCGVTIGAYAFVGAGAVVTRDVRDHMLVTGVPARPAGWVCACGERLTFTGSRAECDRCGRAYVHHGDNVTAIGE